VVVTRLRARRDELVDAIFARMLGDAFDHAGEDDAEYLAGLRATVAAALQYVLEAIEHGKEGAWPLPAVALEQARRAARVGVPLDTVLRRYLAGLATLEDFVVQEADRGELPSRGLRDLLQGMSALVDRLIAAVSRAYGEEVERPGRTPPRSGRVRMSAAGARRDPPSRPSDLISQRDRILQAIVEVAAQRGFERTSVKLVAERAGVSTRTFYEEFADLRDCFEAVLDQALELAGGLIAQAFTREQRWQDGVLGALASLLQFFDSEPALTRIWFVESMSAGSWALARREQIAGALRSMIVEYWSSRGEQAPDPVAAVGVMASVLGLIQMKLVTEPSEPLIELLGPLMGLVTSLYLDKQDVEREVRRGALLARELRAGRSSTSGPGVERPVGAAGPDMTVPGALRDPRAHRMRQCLLYVTRHPGASNQEVGKGIGVSHRGQLARLLGSLLALGLLCKRAGGPGRANAWSPSAEGERVASVLAEQI
jgi:AcrR family transcriptional regulator